MFRRLRLCLFEYRGQMEGVESVDLVFHGVAYNLTVTVSDGADGGGAGGARDPFLGLLLPVDDLKIFGYAAATQVRILVVMRDVLLREDRVRELFRGLHRLYVDAVCAPFSPAGVADAASAEALAQLLGAPRFGTAVARLCEAADLLYRGPVPV